MIRKYFLPLSGGISRPLLLYSSLENRSFIILVMSSLSLGFVLVACAFGVASKEPLPNPGL